MRLIQSGPRNSRICILGEAPGETEVDTGVPFSGNSGQELDRMLAEAGIDRASCFVTNVAHERPPGNDIDNFFHLIGKKKRGPPKQPILDGLAQLRSDLNEIRPELVIALGDTALWAMTGVRGIKKWRGSQLWSEEFECKVLPTWHPAGILRMWSWRFSGMCDLRRAARWIGVPYSLPDWRFVFRPSFETAIETLEMLLARADAGELPLAGDIETRGGHIACFGIAWSRFDAICIPFMCVERLDGYWALEEELALITLVQRLFHHPNIYWIFQNGLYDLQYFARHWLSIPNVACDTMLSHHTCFSGLEKSLAFISSIYNDFHCYWKDDGKNWNPRVGEDSLWNYNCRDAVATYEAANHILETVDKMGLGDQVKEQHRTFRSAFRMMLRGVRIDLSYKADLTFLLDEALAKRQDWLNAAIGRQFNPRSSKQMLEFFNGELGLSVVKNRKTKKPSADDDALVKFQRWRPVLRPLIERIQDLRSAGVFSSTFVQMKLDIDGRARCSYNVAGTETFRFSSSENAFGSGTNLENIPKPNEKSWLPNVRKMYIPDPGFVFLDCDLKQADAQVVAWEADDAELKQMFREGVDVHVENAKTLYSLLRVVEDARERQLAKIGVHAANYGVTAPTLSVSLGITRHEADRFLNRWFSAHPGIKRWQNETLDRLQRTRRVYNKFGYFRHYFDRVEGLLPEALAWIGQSTVALVINRGLNALNETLPEVEPLLQNHDSLLLQVMAGNLVCLLPQIHSRLLISIPYSDPLVIPVDVKMSSASWGELRKLDKNLHSTWNNVKLSPAL